MSMTRRTFLKLTGAAAFISTSLPHALLAQSARTPEPTIPALLYHDIANPANDDFTLAPSSFAAQMEWLFANGYRTLFLDEVMAFVAGGKGKAAVLTFDDGYTSFMDYAFPLLQEYGFTATLNIIGETVDNHAMLENRKAVISWDEGRYLLESGLVELGCHSYALHSTGGVLTVSYPSIEKDLMRFQERYMKELGRRCTIIAWPYGIYDATCIEIARKAGFRSFLTSNEGYIGKNSTIREIPRQNINGKLDLVSFQQYIGAAP